MANEKTGVEVLGTAVKAASEYVIPGGANLIKGDVGTGVVFAVLGLAARAAFGMPGLIAVSLGSLAKSVTGKHALEYLGVWEERRLDRDEPQRPVERRPGRTSSDAAS